MSTIETKIDHAAARAEREKLKRDTPLTAMEKAALPAIIEKWRQVALSTAPADRKEAEQAAVEFYTVNGLEAPREFVWFESPLEPCEISSFGWSGFADLSREVRLAARRACKLPVLREIEDLIGEFSRVPHPYWILHMAGRPPPVQGFPSVNCYGQHFVEWLAFADFCESVLRIPYETQLAPLMRLVAACGFFWPGEGKVAFVARPTV
ncbi:MAG: hypothetical protein ACREO5_04415, partial [Candidatus Binatia bacterium]